jgi:hypothetical protein
VTAYLNIEDALQVVDRSSFHIRDVGFFAAALARPATNVMGAEAYPELPLKAAALLESVARFHPLVDGNKRTAWTLMVLLLWIQRLQTRLHHRRGLRARRRSRQRHHHTHGLSHRNDPASGATLAPPAGAHVTAYRTPALALATPAPCPSLAGDRQTLAAPKMTPCHWTAWQGYPVNSRRS